MSATTAGAGPAPVPAPTPPRQNAPPSPSRTERALGTPAGGPAPTSTRGTPAGAVPLTDKTPSKIAGMFDAIAGRYDLLNHVLSGGIDRYWRWRAVRSLRLTGRERVLDVCTGTADLPLALARPGQASAVVGVDVSSEMLRFGMEKVRRASRRVPIALARGDATHLPLPDASVAAVTVAFGIRNVQDPSVACADMRRVLRPGGRLAVLEFAMPRAAGIRQLYQWYFRVVLPRIGKLISRHPEAYAYLPASVGAWATPREFAELLVASGFAEVRAVSLSFGIVYLYTGVKPG
jgi:demethylmenaquinone methyltransferase / 2-methoxy-6-polyprenyl-1,4-benzoquinol methylase